MAAITGRRAWSRAETHGTPPNPLLFITDYFMSGETDIPHQNLINLYLLDCAKAGRKRSLAWKK